MTTLINIFTTKQKGDNFFECIDPTYKSQLEFKSASTTKIITYKNIELHIDDKQNKKYYKVSNVEYLKSGNIIMQKLLLELADLLTFPIIKAYDNIMTKQSNIYFDKEIKTNINYICETNINNEQHMYMQIREDYDLENLMEKMFS